MYHIHKTQKADTFRAPLVHVYSKNASPLLDSRQGWGKLYTLCVVYYIDKRSTAEGGTRRRVKYLDKHVSGVILLHDLISWTWTLQQIDGDSEEHLFKWCVYFECDVRSFRVERVSEKHQCLYEWRILYSVFEDINHWFLHFIWTVRTSENFEKPTNSNDCRN